MGKFLQRDNIFRTSISPVRTFPIFVLFVCLFFKDRDYFSSVWSTVRPHARIVKTVTEKNAGLSFSWMISYRPYTGHAL